MEKFVRTLFWVAAILALIIGVLRATVISWWTIPEDDPVLAASLAPTLYGGDFVLLLKKAPAFGDITRCTDPEEPGRFVVGRLIGEQRDEIELMGNDIVVNNKRSNREMACEETDVTIQDPTSGTDVDLKCHIEALINHKHMRAVASANRYGVDRKAIVADGRIFLVSDNRAYPFDSRNYGAVERETCKEIVLFRFVGKTGWGDPKRRLLFIQLAPPSIPHKSEKPRRDSGAFAFLVR